MKKPYLKFFRNYFDFNNSCKNRFSNRLSNKGSFIFMALIVISFSVRAQLVTQNSQGGLEYETYANKGQTNAVNKVPDFSRAGYEGGGVALPDVPVEVTVSPGSGDDGARIQDAIIQVSTMNENSDGFRGAVLLKAGTYQVEGTLDIFTNGIVLRGEGQGSSGGTKIIATGQDQRALIQLDGGGGAHKIGNSTAITQSFVPVGSNTIEVASAAAFSVGDDIIIQRTPNQKWLDDMDNMSQWGWTPDYYTVNNKRKITNINSNTLTLDAPIVQTIENQYGSGNVFKYEFTGKITQVGVENLRLESEYDSDDDETHGWTAVSLRGVQNAWVRNVTAQYFGNSCVFIGRSSGDFSSSTFVTVQDCAMLDPKSKTTGGRKYSFIINSVGGQFILFQRCYTRGGRHDYVTQRQVSGPNVFLDCFAEQTNSDIGPHQRYSTGTLYDNIQGGQIEVRNRKGSGSGHGWAGAQIMFWNSKSTINNGNARSYFGIDSPPTGRNWGIGNQIGEQQKGNGLWQSVGKRVNPRSLYLAQLKERLGTDAVKNVTTGDQRAGSIWSKLKDWAGEGDPNTGGEELTAQKYEAEDLNVSDYTQRYYDLNDANASNGKVHRFNGSKVGDYIEYEAYVPVPGIYKVNVGVQKYSSRGIFQLNTPNASNNIGSPQDLYSENIKFGEIEVGEVSFTSAGVKKFRFAVTGKNANSSNFLLVFDYIEIDPVGALGTDRIEKLKNAIRIYPNPTSDRLNIKFNSKIASKATIFIINSSGKQVLKKRTRLNSGLNTISTSLNGLTSGMYIVKIKSEQWEYSQKIIKNNQ